MLMHVNLRLRKLCNPKQVEVHDERHNIPGNKQ